MKIARKLLQDWNRESTFYNFVGRRRKTLLQETPEDIRTEHPDDTEGGYDTALFDVDTYDE